MGLLVALLVNKNSSMYAQAIIMVIAEAIMVFGYFLFECLIYGYEAARVVIITNIMQGAIGVVFGCLLVKYIANKIDLFQKQ